VAKEDLELSFQHSQHFWLCHFQNLKIIVIICILQNASRRSSLRPKRWSWIHTEFG